jgi:hypothetical protein
MLRHAGNILIQSRCIICMYACMYVCMYVCIFTSSCPQYVDGVYICMYACMHVCMYVIFGHPARKI